MTSKIEYTVNSTVNKSTLLHLYKSMLKPRLIEEKMLILLRQGKNIEMVFWYWSRKQLLLV